MNTSFFTQLAKHKGIKSTIAISTDANGNMVVSFLPKPMAVSDDATTKIQPFTIKGKGTEIDERFFDAITTPLEQTVAFFDNSDSYMKTLELAKAQSKKEIDRKAKLEKLKKDTNALMNDEEQLSKNEKKIRANILAIRKIDVNSKFAIQTMETLKNSQAQANLF